MGGLAARYRIAVMYLGKFVELADKPALFKTSLHPYTKALLSAIPSNDPTNKSKRIILEGDTASDINPKSGCKFLNRCIYAKDICSDEEPL